MANSPSLSIKIIMVFSRFLLVLKLHMVQYWPWSTRKGIISDWLELSFISLSVNLSWRSSTFISVSRRMASFIRCPFRSLAIQFLPSAPVFYAMRYYLVGMYIVNVYLVARICSVEASYSCMSIWNLKQYQQLDQFSCILLWVMLFCLFPSSLIFFHIFKHYVRTWCHVNYYIPLIGSLSVIWTCSMPKTLERYQKCSYSGPDTAVQNKENEVYILFYLFLVQSSYLLTPV